MGLKYQPVIDELTYRVTRTELELIELRQQQQDTLDMLTELAVAVDDLNLAIQTLFSQFTFSSHKDMN